MIHPGGTTGPYTWIRLLGHGSSGEVWAAERDGRQMAVKVFRNAAFRSPFVEAIRREARIGKLIAGLPGVVAVQHVESRDGNLYLEMEWVRGPSIDQVLHGRLKAGLGPIPPSVAAPWAVQVLRTLDAVSRRVAPERPRSFLHRDIKPGNLLLRPTNGTICVTDFGVARAEAELGFETTRTGVVKGSPRFMAPELLLERLQDARADQFALGVVLYELITGEPLYDGKDIATVLTLVSAADVREKLDALQVPPDLATVLRAMLSRDRAGRYPSARDAALALDTLVLTGPPPAALLKELLRYSTGYDYDPTLVSVSDDDTDIGAATLLAGDDEDTLIDHPDDETTMVSAGVPNAEPTWAPTDAQPAPVAPEDETEVLDARKLRDELNRGDEAEGED